MTHGTTPVFSHESRDGAFPYMSASTYFPLPHQCWHCSLRPVRWPGSRAVSLAWKQICALWLTRLVPDYLSRTLTSDLVQFDLNQARPFHFLPSARPFRLGWLGPEVMGIQGMELFAIGVVIILFMAVLKQFGILEPISSIEGKGPPEAPQLNSRYLMVILFIFNILMMCYISR